MQNDELHLTQSNSKKDQQINPILQDSQNEQNQNQNQQYSIMIQQDEIYNLKIRFSNQFKHQWIKLNQSKTQAKNVLQELAFVLCEPSIPNNSIVQYNFRTGNNSGIIIGICEKQNFKTQTITTKDMYLLNDYGYSSLNFDIEQESEQIEGEFGWGCNEIINIQVNTKVGKIKWTKVSTQQSYILDIDLTKCFFPFVGLGIQSSLEILDNT